MPLVSAANVRKQWVAGPRSAKLTKDRQAEPSARSPIRLLPRCPFSSCSLSHPALQSSTPITFSTPVFNGHCPGYRTLAAPCCPHWALPLSVHCWDPNLCLALPASSAPRLPATCCPAAHSSVLLTPSSPSQSLSSNLPDTGELSLSFQGQLPHAPLTEWKVNGC